MIRTAGRSFWLGLALLAALTPACGGGDVEPAADPRPQGPPPNLVLVVIDTLRPDHLGIYGYDRETAPYLAELSTRSTVFRHAYSTSSWTAPATASVFTGMYPNRHGVLTGFRAQRHSFLDGKKRVEGHLELISLPEVPTLVEQLRAAGYATFGVASNLNISPELGFDRGFDEFVHLYKDDAEVLAETALGWREAMSAGGPSFLYLHFNDVHKPYEARDPAYEPLEDETQDRVARYDSEITYLDGWLSRLHQELGWDEDTVLLVVSDHGEEFRDHGGVGHGYSLYRELNQVLMLLHAPGLDPAAALVDVPVSLIDVLPTLREVAGLDPFEHAQGRSLLPFVGGGGADVLSGFEDRTLFAHRIGGRDPGPLHERPPVWSAIRGRWKLIRNDKTERVELYDLLEDPAETVDLIVDRADVAAELKRALSEFERGTRRLEGERVEVELTESLYEHLQELGYAGND